VSVSSGRLWFMDVDGVMAPFGKGGAFKDWVRSPHERFELWLSPIQAAAIRRVLEETETDLIWVTTWAHEAAEHVEGFLGWPNHRFAPRPQGEVFGDTTGSNGRWWKLDAVERFLTELQPARYVWSDDDHPAHRADVSAALRQLPGLPLVQAPTRTSACQNGGSARLGSISAATFREHDPAQRSREEPVARTRPRHDPTRHVPRRTCSYTTTWDSPGWGGSHRPRCRSKRRSHTMRPTHLNPATSGPPGRWRRGRGSRGW
jgi:hypothetical protein